MLSAHAMTGCEDKTGAEERAAAHDCLMWPQGGGDHYCERVSIPDVSVPVGEVHALANREDFVVVLRDETQVVVAVRSSILHCSLGGRLPRGARGASTAGEQQRQGQQ